MSTVLPERVAVEGLGEEMTGQSRRTGARTSIQAIELALPANEVTNADLAREHSSWDMDLLAELSGVQSRRICSDGETAFDLSARACEAMFARTDVDANDVDAILYCTLHPDHPTPGNAHLLHRQLELDDRVFALDFPLACSGFVYGLSLADALIESGRASMILLVTAEAASTLVHPGDRSLRILVGDGAAVTCVSDRGPEGGRVVASELCTHGGGFEHAWIPAGGARRPSNEATRRETVDPSGNVRTAENLHMDGPTVWAFVNSTIPGHIRDFLAKHSLGADDIDIWIFHQGGALILRSLTKALEVPSSKVFMKLEDVGNLSSSSIPFALRAARDEGAIKAGNRVLLCAFGAGMSYGSAIVEF